MPNHLPEKSLLLTTRKTNDNKPRGWQPRRNITSSIASVFHRSFFISHRRLNEINQSGEWYSNREESKFSSTLKRSRPYLLLCFEMFWSSEIQGTGSFDRIDGKWDITWQRKIDRGNNIEMSSMTAAGALHGSQTIAARFKKTKTSCNYKLGNKVRANCL